jgi:DNA-binding transcriptional LysR family regulator
VTLPPDRRETLSLMQEVLAEDFACVVARCGHPLTRRKSLSISDLTEWEWILPPPETTLRRQIDIAFLEEGLKPPRRVVDSVSLLTNRQLLLAADYLGVFPAQVARQEASLGSVVILPVALRATASVIGVTMRPNGILSPAAEVFLQSLRAAAAELA